MNLTTFASTGKAYVEAVFEASWSDIVPVLLEHQAGDSKADIPLYNLVTFKTLDDPTTQLGRRYHGQMVDGAWTRDSDGTWDPIPNTVRRCKDNVVGIWAIVLDIDEKQTIEQAIDMLGELEYILYTTFRHTKQQHKFRIILPFTQMLKIQDIPGREASIRETFPDVDSASFTVSQSFYFHSGKNDSIAYHNKGTMLDPYKHFEYREVEIYVPEIQPIATDMTTAQQQLYRDSVVKSLRTCNGLHYAGDETNKDGVLTLISICKSIGLSFDEFDDICSNMAHPDSLLVTKSTRAMAWTGWAGNRIRRDKRDKFIKDYGGEPIPRSMWAQEKEDIKEILKLYEGRKK